MQKIIIDKFKKISYNIFSLIQMKETVYYVFYRESMVGANR